MKHSLSISLLTALKNPSLRMYRHYFRFSFVVVVAAMCLGATRAEYEAEYDDHGLVQQAPYTTNNDLNEMRYQPLVLPHYLALGNLQGDQLHHRRNVIAYGEMDRRVPRSLRQSSFPRPGPKPHPSPTFPRPNTQPRFRRESMADEELLTRDIRSTQIYKSSSPVPTLSQDFSVSEDFHGPVLARFRRGNTKVSVDVGESRGSQSTTTLSAQRNVFKSNDRRTTVDAGGYVTNRGDRGGRIDVAHGWSEPRGTRVSVDTNRNRYGQSSTTFSAQQNIYKSDDGRLRVDASGYATNRGDRGGMVNMSYRP